MTRGHVAAACSSSAEEKSQTILKQWEEWHVINSCDQLGETLRAAPTQVWVGHSSQVFTLFEGLAVQKDTLFKTHKTLKTIPCSAAHTRTGQVKGVPPGVTSNRGKKKTVKRQADTKTQWNTSQVSLFYSFHFIHLVSPHHHHRVPSTGRGRLSLISSFSDIPLFLHIHYRCVLTILWCFCIQVTLGLPRPLFPSILPSSNFFGSTSL